MNYAIKFADQYDQLNLFSKVVVLTILAGIGIPVIILGGYMWIIGFIVGHMAKLSIKS